MKQLSRYILFTIIAVAAVTCWAQNPDTTSSTYMLMPLVFDKQHTATTPTTSPQPLQGLKVDNSWLDRAMQRNDRNHHTRYRMMIENPELVHFNEGSLPKAPKVIPVETDPSGSELKIETKDIDSTLLKPVDRREIKVHNWLHSFSGSLHGTQAYISNNWYQGGENNLNLLADLQWDCNLNQKLHPNWLFNNSLHYKLGIATAKGDSLRSYTINEDNFQFSSQLGYKAMKNWYYSANLLFKTQLFNNYVVNTRNLAASFLSSGELLLGLGMTYSYKDKNEYKIFTLSIAPLSYDLKICRDIDRIDPTKFGIDAGHHTKHSFGSSLEAKFEWKITPSITWKSRLYAFTDYHYAQGDWENTFSFSASSHLNTQIFTHLRYDKSRPWDPDWKFWQFKEILSFGLIYKFATK